VERLRAGELWQEQGLVFASRIGTPLTANNVIRAFRIITKKAGLGEDWVPREMRHTFVSVLSANGVPVESIALLAGHDVRRRLCHVGAAAVHSDNQTALAKQHRGAPHSVVGDPAVAG